MSKRFQNGFTLIELLIVVSLVAILAGITISILNPTVLRNRARDGVIAGNVAKIAQALEAFNAAEGHYIDVSTDATLCSPSGTTDKQILMDCSGYIQNWPSDTTYTYQGYSENSKIFGCISAPMATSSTKYFKYVSPYVSGSTNTCTIGNLGSDCAGKVLFSCKYDCNSPLAGKGNDFDECVATK